MLFVRILGIRVVETAMSRYVNKENTMSRYTARTVDDILSPQVGVVEKGYRKTCEPDQEFDPDPWDSDPVPMSEDLKKLYGHLRYFRLVVLEETKPLDVAEKYWSYKEASRKDEFSRLYNHFWAQCKKEHPSGETTGLNLGVRKDWLLVITVAGIM